MSSNSYTDPLLILARSRQIDLLKEAEDCRQVRTARGLLGTDGRPEQKKDTTIIPIWRKIAWGLGRAAFSLGFWLMAR